MKILYSRIDQVEDSLIERRLLLVGIEKISSPIPGITPQTGPNCGDAVQINCSGSACNTMNNK